jgi:hypothetical protein
LGARSGDFDAEGRDLLGALDPATFGAGEAAAVSDRGGVGVEEADVGVDVSVLECPVEVTDDAGLPRWGVAGTGDARMRRTARGASQGIHRPARNRDLAECLAQPPAVLHGDGEEHALRCRAGAGRAVRSRAIDIEFRWR